MAQGIIFAYSHNKFHATLTMRAQNTISAPTCVPETRFCCLKICGWDSGQPFVKSPGSSNTRPPCTYMKGKFPTPVNCLSGKFPGVFRGGGGMVTPGIDSCIIISTRDNILFHIIILRGKQYLLQVFQNYPPHPPSASVRHWSISL
jgi:hypothetical protein